MVELVQLLKANMAKVEGLAAERGGGEGSGGDESEELPEPGRQTHSKFKLERSLPPCRPARRELQATAMSMSDTAIQTDNRASALATASQSTSNAVQTASAALPSN